MIKIIIVTLAVLGGVILCRVYVPSVFNEGFHIQQYFIPYVAIIALMIFYLGFKHAK